jgi:glycosyltransferase involved in cell wall biosynthesis|tara:strand:+ start:2141 stop:2308 length:168 start_codon:yes stop_codon:yes gene_type:complete
MSLSVIIPVYNEEQNAIKTINNLIKLKKYIRKLEIIFIDDFSNDNTFKKINQSFK